MKLRPSIVKKNSLQVWQKNKYHIFHWGKLISFTASAQILIQAIGLIVGIITIRLLSVQEYAWFTLANTMLGALSILSDGGISSGVMAEAGKDWQNKEHVGKVLATGLYMRKRFAIYSMFIILPFLAYLLFQNGALWWQIMLIISALIPAYYAALSDSLLEIPIKLHQNMFALQQNQLFTAFGRLLIGAVSLMMLPFTFIALIANGLPRIWANFQLKKIVNEYISNNSDVDSNIRRNLFKIVKRSLPNSIFFLFYGQLTIWIISLFGNTNSIAEIGALSRITIIFTAILTICDLLIVPNFAKLNANAKFSIKKIIQVQIIVFLIGLMIFFVIFLGSENILWVFGPNYKNLVFELHIVSLTSFIGFLSSFNYRLCISKGWVLRPIVLIPFRVFPVIISIFLFKISTLKGAIYLSLMQNFFGYFLYFVFLINKCLKLK